MKAIRIILVVIVCLSLCAITFADSFSKFDEYCNIFWSDEKARLDNLALAINNDSEVVVWIIVYAGTNDCSGKSRARAIRARKHLVEKRGLSPDRVMWKDGGYREQQMVELWAWPRRSGTPTATPYGNQPKGGPVICNRKSRKRC